MVFFWKGELERKVRNTGWGVKRNTGWDDKRNTGWGGKRNTGRSGKEIQSWPETGLSGVVSK